MIIDSGIYDDYHDYTENHKKLFVDLDVTGKHWQAAEEWISKKLV